MSERYPMESSEPYLAEWPMLLAGVGAGDAPTVTVGKCSLARSSVGSLKLTFAEDPGDFVGLTPGGFTDSAGDVTALHVAAGAYTAATPSAQASLVVSTLSKALLKRTFTGLTAAGTFDLTAIDGTGETTGTGNPNRVPVASLLALRVTAATTGATVGSYVVGDSGATTLSATTHTVVGLCKISDDGKSITFPTADVTAFVIEYVPSVGVLVDLTATQTALFRMTFKPEGSDL